MIRERLLKAEIKTENIYEYIDGRNALMDQRLNEIAKDIGEFKTMNKEAAKTLAENMTAVRELRFVLDLIKHQLKNGNTL